MQEKKKIGFFSSIKFKVVLVAVAAIFITFFAVTLVILLNTKQTLKKTNGNYLLDMANLTGYMMNTSLAAQGEEEALKYENLESIFYGVGIKGVESSYAYVVSKDGTMMYHPTATKVGNPVENACVKQVVSDIATGKAKPGDKEFVAYIYNKEDKYAAYYIADDYSIVVVTADEEEVMDSQKQLVKLAAIVGFSILAIAAVIIALVSEAIVRPIVKITDVIDRAGRLEFTKTPGMDKLQKRKDETGMMANSVHEMKVQIVDVVKSLQGQSGTLKEASNDLNSSARETANTVEQVEKAVAEIAEGATNQAEETQKATESVILMGNMVEETNEEVKKLSETAEIMKQSGMEATETLEELEKINEMAKQSIDVIYEQTNTTNVSANKIREATSIITSIAEETNLLSLNASIEAARAGDAGRGFAVVASQISKLAEQSNESARSIENIIESLITDSTKAVETMNEVQGIMKEQNEKVTLTGEKFALVKNGIETSIEGVTNIADKTKKLDDARITVVDVVQNLTAIAEENAASTEETSASVTEVSAIVAGISDNANTLDGVAMELQENVNKFTL